MEVFEGVFTKRGEAETSDSNSNSTGAFEDVFVRRGRWRKGPANTSQQTRGDVVRLAEHVASGQCTVEYPMPSLSDIANADLSKSDDAVVTDPAKGSDVMPTNVAESMQQEAFANQTPFIVKNTFLDASVIDFDSLKDFLKARQVKSCPASRQVSTVTMLIDDIAAMQEMCISGESDLKDEVLNTASSFGGLDIPHVMTTQKDALECLDDESLLPSGSEADQALMDYVLNTASTFTGADFEMFQQRIAEVSQQNDQANPPTSEEPEFFNTASAPSAAMADNVDEQQLTPEDRLRHLRMKGSAIQQKIDQCAPQETQWASGAGVGHQPFPHWLGASNGVTPGLEALLGSLQQQQQVQSVQPFPPPPSEPPVISATVTAGMSAPVPPPPPPPPPLVGATAAAPPVIRLADAIEYPELGTPELPSIGSMLHFKKECKPCTFFHTRGCENKEKCEFCHLCGPGEKKKRIKAMKAVQREANFNALEAAKLTLASYRAAEEQNFQADMIIE